MRACESVFVKLWHVCVAQVAVVLQIADWEGGKGYETEQQLRGEAGLNLWHACA